MKLVQVAIPDPEYADSIRNLLVQDRGHRVQLVERPDVTLGGVIIVDAANLDSLRLPPKERERLIVLVRKERDDLFKIWDAGVRHVVFDGDPPQTARVVVLGVELGLALNYLAHMEMVEYRHVARYFDCCCFGNPYDCHGVFWCACNITSHGLSEGKTLVQGWLHNLRRVSRVPCCMARREERTFPERLSKTSRNGRERIAESKFANRPTYTRTTI